MMYIILVIKYPIVLYVNVITEMSRIHPLKYRGKSSILRRVARAWGKARRGWKRLVGGWRMAESFWYSLAFAFRFDVICETPLDSYYMRTISPVSDPGRSLDMQTIPDLYAETCGSAMRIHFEKAGGVAMKRGYKIMTKKKEFLKK